MLWKLPTAAVATSQTLDCHSATGRPAEIWFWEEQQGAYPIRDKILRRLVLVHPSSLPPGFRRVLLFCLPHSANSEGSVTSVCGPSSKCRPRLALFKRTFLKAVCLFIVEGSGTKPTPGPVLWTHRKEQGCVYTVKSLAVGGGVLLIHL